MTIKIALPEPRAMPPSVTARRAGAVLAVAVLVLPSLGQIAAAEDASRWDGDARLLAGSASGSSGTWHAGIEIRLKPGWHTYWRYPGDAGVPPRFDFAGSHNVRSVTVAWPAPRALKEEGLTAIGYDTTLVLPLLVEPQNSGELITLRLKLEYAVCEKQCVPAEAKLELALSTSRSWSQNNAIAAALARVPRKARLGDDAALAIKSLRRVDAGGRPRAVVEVAAPTGTNVALFAEGPSPDWALPVPTAAAGASSGLSRFEFELDGAPPGASYQSAAITLTAVAGNEAIEVVARLD